MTNLKTLATIELPLYKEGTVTFDLIECSQGVVLKQQNYKGEVSLVNLDYNLVIKREYVYYSYPDMSLFDELDCSTSESLELVIFDSKEDALKTLSNWLGKLILV